MDKKLKLGRTTTCIELLQAYSRNLHEGGQIGEPGYAMAAAVVETAEYLILSPTDSNFAMFKALLEAVYGEPVVEAISHASYTFAGEDRKGEKFLWDFQDYLQHMTQ